MRRDIQQYGKTTGIIFAALLLFAIVYRIPVASGQVRVSFMVIMEISLTLALATVLWQYNKYIAAFLVMAMISMFYPHYGPMSFYAQKMVFIGCLWYFLLVHYVENIDPFLDAMCYGALINLLVQCLQVVMKDLGEPFFLGCQAPVGLMANPNEISALYVFCLPAFFLKMRNNLNWIMGIPFIFLGMILSETLMGFACLWVGFVVWLFHQRKYWWVLGAMLSAVLVCALIFVPIKTLFLRYAVWDVTFPILKQHWIMGAGIGHWKLLFKGAMPFDGQRWTMAHNEFYQLWAEMGVIPLVLVGLYFIDILRKHRREFVFTAVAISMIAVNSVGNFCWHIAPLAMIAITWLAILEINLRKGITSDRRI